MGELKFFEFQFEIRPRDFDRVGCVELIDCIKCSLDPLLKSLSVVPSHLSDCCVTLIIKRSRCDANRSIRHSPPLGLTVIHRKTRLANDRSLIADLLFLLGALRLLVTT